MSSLAARCTACGTVFRVVPDQLRVAGGLVRCGRCSEVFNAAESLIDLDTWVPPATPSIATPASSTTPEPEPEPVREQEQEPEPESALASPPAAAPADESAPAPSLAEDALAEPTSPEADSPAPDSWEPLVEAPESPPAAVAELTTDLSTHFTAYADLPAPALADEEPPAPAPGAEPGTDFELQLLPAVPAPPPEPRSSTHFFDLPPPRELNSPEPDLDFPPAPAPVRPEPELDPEERVEPAWATPLPSRLPSPVPSPAPPQAPAAEDATTPGPARAMPEVTVNRAYADEDPGTVLGGTLADAPTAPAAAEDTPAVDESVPSFLRKAERAQRWRTPRMRAALGAGVVVGVLLLAGQLVHSYRDLIAARHPQALALLEKACSALGCRIEAPRLVDSLAVESSGLVRVEKSAVYKLQLALRNRDSLAVAMPALDLTLSDAQGKPLARRVLRMSELGVTDTTLAAGRELVVQATLQAAFTPASTTVAGYTIELFYP